MKPTLLIAVISMQNGLHANALPPMQGAAVPERLKATAWPGPKLLEAEVWRQIMIRGEIALLLLVEVALNVSLSRGPQLVMTFQARSSPGMFCYALRYLRMVGHKKGIIMGASLQYLRKLTVHRSRIAPFSGQDLQQTFRLKVFQKRVL